MIVQNMKKYLCKSSDSFLSSIEDIDFQVLQQIILFENFNDFKKFQIPVPFSHLNLSIKLSVSTMDYVGDVGKCCFRFYCLTESRRGLSTHAIHKSLVEVWGVKAPRLTTVKRWIKDFLEGSRGNLEDLPRPGRPTSTRTNNNIATVHSLITQDPKFSVRCIENEANITRETARMLLKNELQMKKVCYT